MQGRKVNLPILRMEVIIIMPVGPIIATVVSSLVGLAANSAGEKIGNAVQKKQDAHREKKSKKKK